MTTVLTGLWREILGLDEKQTAALEYHSDFFELGGDLVLAAVLATRLREFGRYEMSVERVIDCSEFGKMLKALVVQV
ncbi:hypothetical protein HBI50_094750 [Parastagonospora nodorum]|nr:hypothetical protein HBI50_094750 [Parastagonospora nodorum]